MDTATKLQKADLRHDLDSTAKIQGNMLKRETDRIARLEVL